MNEYIRDYINSIDKSVLKKKEDYITHTNTYTNNYNNQYPNISVYTGDISFNNRKVITKRAIKCDYYNYHDSKKWDCYRYDNQSFYINTKELIYTNLDINYPDLKNPNNFNNIYLNVILILITILLILRVLGRAFR